MTWSIFIIGTVFCAMFFYAGYKIAETPPPYSGEVIESNDKTEWSIMNAESHRWCAELKDELAVEDIPGEVRIEPSAISGSPTNYVYILMHPNAEDPYDEPHFIISEDEFDNTDKIVVGYYENVEHSESQDSVAALVDTRTDAIEWVKDKIKLEELA